MTVPDLAVFYPYLNDKRYGKFADIYEGTPDL